jgi:hypothetical protein
MPVHWTATHPGRAVCCDTSGAPFAAYFLDVTCPSCREIVAKYECAWIKDGEWTTRLLCLEIRLSKNESVSDIDIQEAADAWIAAVRRGIDLQAPSKLLACYFRRHV